jgi:hypothetical protein
VGEGDNIRGGDWGGLNGEKSGERKKGKFGKIWEKKGIR